MVFPILEILVFVFCIAQLIILVRKHCKKDSHPTTFERTLVSLCLSDLVIAVTGIYQYWRTTELKVEELRNRPFLRFLNVFAMEFSVIASILNLSLLSIERTVSTTRPHHYRDIFSPNKVILMIASAWIINVILTVVMVLVALKIHEMIDNYILLSLTLCCSVALFASYFKGYLVTRKSRIRTHSYASPGMKNGKPSGRNCKINCVTIQEGMKAITINQTSQNGISVMEVSDKTDNHMRYDSSLIFKGKDTYENSPPESSAAVKKTIKKHLEIQDQQTKALIKRERRSLMFGIFISLAFMVCYFPLTFYSAIFPFSRARQPQFITLFFFARLNSLINPIVYFAFFSKLRCKRFSLTPSNPKNISSTNGIPSIKS